MGPLISVVLVVVLMWVVWRVSPRRRMLRGRDRGTVLPNGRWADRPANQNVDLAIVEQHTRDVGGPGGGGIGGIGI